MNIAVYSGSFNPLHIGHLAIIKHLIEEAGFDMVYLIVSPKNPLKDTISIDSAIDRYNAAIEAVNRHFGMSTQKEAAECGDDMPPPARGRERFSKWSSGPLLRTATEGKAGVSGIFSADSTTGKVKVDNIELTMPEPHYTIRTLDALKEREPGNNFTLTIGSDNLASIRKWKDYTRILKEYGVAVFPREGFDTKKIKQDLLNENPAYKIRLLEAPLVTISSTQIREAMQHGEDMSEYLM